MTGSEGWQGKGLTKLFADSGIPCQVTGVGSIFLTHFGTTAVMNATDVAKSDRELLKGIPSSPYGEPWNIFLPTKMAAISFAHEERDIEKLLDATEKKLSQAPTSSSAHLHNGDLRIF